MLKELKLLREGEIKDVIVAAANSVVTGVVSVVNNFLDDNTRAVFTNIQSVITQLINDFKNIDDDVRNQYMDFNNFLANAKNILDENKITDDIFKHYKGLIDIIKDYFLGEKYKSNIETGMTETEITTRATEIAGSLVPTPREEGTRGKLCRTNAFVSASSTSPQAHTSVEQTPLTDQSQESENDPKKLMADFNTQYIKILKIVKDGINTTSTNSVGLNGLVSIINKLPYYDDSLKFLTKENNYSKHSLKVSYLKILMILKARCSGWTASICNMAARAAGPVIYALYDELQVKKKSLESLLPNISSGEDGEDGRDVDSINRLAVEISDDELLQFINKIIPVLQLKLKPIKEFNGEMIEINKLQPKISGLCTSSGGGRARKRKSSKNTHTHKEILGKQMKIYKMPNDKKEYVKHKGVLITVKQYKEVMKSKADTKKVVNKKIILGKERCVYKVPGSKKEHVKYKGAFIAVTDYIKLMKNPK